MSHTVLYRKYRPQKFADVMGQDHIVSVFEEAIKKDKIAHAYIFSGPRGTGKTSIARILARELKISSNDITEIDAASNRGVDDIRTLREGVRTLPFDSSRKIYIIDEAHMLTKEAFNALLKTLEEPPEHVIFVLATTEPEKIIDTIHSRCQHFKFKRPSEIVIRDLMIKSAKAEGLTLEKSAAEIIAMLADGSFRDAYGILEKVSIVSKDKKLSRVEVELITGAPPQSLIINFLDSIARGDIEGSILSLRDAEKAGVDDVMFLRLVINALRIAMMLKFAPASKKKIEEEHSEDYVKSIEGILDPNRKLLGSKNLSIFLEAYNDLKFSSVDYLPIEIAVYKIIEGESI